jgi:PAS domain-containing protein
VRACQVCTFRAPSERLWQYLQWEQKWLTMDFEDKLIGRIYDCAANPDLWPAVLREINNGLGSAYTMMLFADFSPITFGQQPFAIYRHSGWEESWLKSVMGLVREIPGSEKFQGDDIDRAWTQMSQITEDEFKKTNFYRAWVKPQKLRDCLIISYLKRPNLLGLLVTASAEGKPLFGRKQCEFVERMSPHLRRAALINELVDAKNLQIALYRNVMDKLSTAVFIIGAGNRIVYANEAAGDMLSSGNLIKSVTGRLAASMAGKSQTALNEALLRAKHGDAKIGIRGIGVPLSSEDGERAAAYLLPISGQDVRGEMGDGFCAVFIGKRRQHMPLIIEILRTVHNLTEAEARAAALVAKGSKPADIAMLNNISINTVRTQLTRAMEKTGTETLASMGAAINALVPMV